MDLGWFSEAAACHAKSEYDRIWRFSHYKTLDGDRKELNEVAICVNFDNGVVVHATFCTSVQHLLIDYKGVLRETETPSRLSLSSMDAKSAFFQDAKTETMTYDPPFSASFRAIMFVQRPSSDAMWPKFDRPVQLCTRELHRILFPFRCTCGWFGDKRDLGLHSCRFVMGICRKCGQQDLSCNILSYGPSPLPAALVHFLPPELVTIISVYACCCV